MHGDGHEGGRLTVDVLVRPGQGSTLADDVRVGLSAPRKWLPPKHLYDGVGSELFDAICETPEYYPTRTELGLLDRYAGAILDAAGSPDELVELGSGAARKTRALLEPMLARHDVVTYAPVDVSESMLRASAETLLADYPTLRVHGVVADYDHHLDRIPHDGRNLVAFLGGTMGNFDHDDGVRFLRGLRGGLAEGDRLLVGLDQVKDAAVLEAAYDDAEGITARFNKNVLAVINARLGGGFDLDRFDHVARWDPDLARIEMHLRARDAHEVRIEALDMTVPFAAGETILTEISRKFTRPSAEALFRGAGLALDAWWTPDDGWFALALAHRVD